MIDITSSKSEISHAKSWEGKRLVNLILVSHLEVLMSVKYLSESLGRLVAW